MATQVGKGHIYGLGGGALGIASISGYISPNMQSLRLADVAPTHPEIKDQSGEVSGKIFVTDDILECTFEFVPEGSNIANAKKSAWLPAKGAPVTITGLPVFQMGAFADALNTDSGSTQPWFYEGGGQFNGPNDSNWTLTLPLKRYKGITSGTPIV